MLEKMRNVSFIQILFCWGVVVVVVVVTVDAVVSRKDVTLASYLG